MRKLIAYLYNKYCRQDIKTLYIGGIQRNFDIEIDENQKKEFSNVAYSFVNSDAFYFFMVDLIKPYVDILVCKGESEKLRDSAVFGINVILKAEEYLKAWSSRPEQEKFDKYEPI
jgi:hypothetical protein